MRHGVEPAPNESRIAAKSDVRSIIARENTTTSQRVDATAV